MNQYGLSIDAELASDGGHALTVQFQNHDEFPQCDHRPRWEEHRRFGATTARPGMPRVDVRKLVGASGEFMFGAHSPRSRAPSHDLRLLFGRPYIGDAAQPVIAELGQWGPDSSIVLIVGARRAQPRFIAKHHSRSRRPLPEAHVRGLIRRRQLQAGSNQAISLSRECICANWLVF